MYADRTDEELIKLTLEGDDRAFGQIVTKYSRMMFGLCYRILRDPTLAEEAVQESFVKVWKNAGEWKGEMSSLSTWIYKITTNTCIDYKRKLVRRGEQELDDNIANEFDENSKVEKEELVELVESLIGKLSEAQAICITLFYKNELKQAEIAQTLGISLKAVESNLLRGKRKLAEILEQKGIKLTDLAI